MSDDPTLPAKPACPACATAYSAQELAAALRTCPSCGHHYRMEPSDRIAYIADPGSFKEFSANLRSLNPIDLVGYEEKSPGHCSREHANAFP